MSGRHARTSFRAAATEWAILMSCARPSSTQVIDSATSESRPMACHTQSGVKGGSVQAGRGFRPRGGVHRDEAAALVGEPDAVGGPLDEQPVARLALTQPGLSARLRNPG